MPGKKDSFCHLHTHTEFSMLDGAARITDAVAAAVADGQPALGITDHGNMYGVLDFYRACRDAGITPVIGMEAYMAAESRLERPPRRGKVDDTGGEVEGGDKLYYHLTLLAETNAGYRNLMKLSSAAYLEGYYYKPRLDWELLERHHQGIIATTGCLGGIVAQALLRDDVAGATKAAERLQDIFGPEHLFVELQDHGLAAQHKTNPLLVDIARHLGAPLLATNDSHYTRRSDAAAHDALLCVQTGSTMDDPTRFHFEGEEHYLKSAGEMRALFDGATEACDNTLWIAERAQVEIELGQPRLPEFPVPERFQAGAYEDGAAAYLRHLTYEGAAARYGSPLPDKVTERLDYELSVIGDMGFAAYFLVVWDLVRYARERKIRVGPGRGSAAGCCVAYCLRIVDIDPIRWDLLFERFLNPGRKQMPDIDMDFDERYRGEMIRYASQRYGADHVAQIVTFSTIKARAAVRDSTRVLGLPYALGDRVAKSMPPLVMGRDTPLDACLERTEGHEDGYKAAASLREMYEADPDARRVIDVARGLAGLRRQDSIHAAAVVITHEPLIEHLPIQRKPDPSGTASDAPVVTQYEMHGVEELGLLKMDILGVRNLSVIERALDLIERSTGGRPDVDAIPLDDPATFEMLRKGDSVGVFQLEGGPMRALMRSLAPSAFEDLAALIALYRPGPMAANMHNDYADRKCGRKPVTYPHPDLTDLLGDTYGLMIYQESMMRVAQRMAGYSLSEADNLRKACGKKIRALIAAERVKFVAGCAATGYGAEMGTKLFDIIEPFADYAFGKAHAYGYAYITYQTAWLKANHPVEYMAALLTSVADDKDKTAVYLAECRSRGIKVLVPDVNVSIAAFSALRPSAAPVATVAPPAPARSEVQGQAAGQTGETYLPQRDASFPTSSEAVAATAGAAPGGVGAAAGVTGAGAIPFGMAAVRNVGAALVGHIVAERERAGPYRDFYDFCARVDPSVLNKRSLESLIKAGAFDSLGHPRQGLCVVFEQIVDRTLARRREADLGIMTLFGALGLEPAGAPVGSGREGGGGTEQDYFDDARLPIPDMELDKAHRLAFEKEMLGLYVSDHPMMGVEAALRRLTDTGLAELRDAAAAGTLPEGTVRVVGGVVTSLSRRWTKAGKLMANFVLEDLEAAMEVFVFPQVMSEQGDLLVDDAIVCVKARLDTREEQAKLVCLEVTRPVLTCSGAQPLVVSLAPGTLTESRLACLKALLLEHPGDSPVHLMLGESGFRLPAELNAEPQRGLVGSLRELFGPCAVG